MRRDALRPISYLLGVLGAKPKLLSLNFGDAQAQESKLQAQGKFLELLLGDKAHLLTETIQ